MSTAVTRPSFRKPILTRAKNDGLIRERTHHRRRFEIELILVRPCVLQHIHVDGGHTAVLPKTDLDARQERRADTRANTSSAPLRDRIDPRTALRPAAHTCRRRS